MKGMFMKKDGSKSRMDEERLEFDVDELIAKGKKGDLSESDLDAALETMDYDIDSLDRLYETLEDNGIPLPGDLSSAEMNEIEQEIKLIAAAMEGYNLYILPGGGAEQDPEEWWQAICSTTKTVFGKCDIKPDQIEGISFCSQMQGLVLVDDNLKPVHRAFSYMDQRAKKQIKEGIANGIQIAGANIFKLIPSLMITGAVSASVKDPVWKYNWVKENEPELYAKIVEYRNILLENKEV